MKQSRIIATLGLVVALSLCAWMYFSPYLAVRGLQSAAQERNAARMADYVDFPSVRESLKASLNAMLAAEMAKASGGQANPFAALAAAFVSALVEKITDAFVSPEGLAMLMRGEKPDFQKGQPTGASTDGDPFSSDAGYETFDRFVVTVKPKSGKESIGLVFTRQGLVAWKLTALRLEGMLATKEGPPIASPPASEVAQPVQEPASPAEAPALQQPGTDTSGQAPAK